MTTKIVNGQRVDCTPEELAALESERAEYATTVAEQEVKLHRAMAYPSIADQLDQIYHEGIDAWKETIAAVKAEYPKP